MNYGSDEQINFALGLEVERVDMTHTNKPLSDRELRFPDFAKGKRELRAKSEQLDSMREQRDKLFFNAGRAAGGATDSVAIQAKKIVDLLLEDEV